MHMHPPNNKKQNKKRKVTERSRIRVPAALLELHCFATISWVISEELSKSSEEYRTNPVGNVPGLSDEPLWHPLKMFSRFVEESLRALH